MTVTYFAGELSMARVRAASMQCNPQFGSECAQ